MPGLQFGVFADDEGAEEEHRALEDEIAEAMVHPSTDDLKIAELKRKKLLVKDEIGRLRDGDRVEILGFIGGGCQAKGETDGYER